VEATVWARFPPGHETWPSDEDQDRESINPRLPTVLPTRNAYLAKIERELAAKEFGPNWKINALI